MIYHLEFSGSAHLIGFPVISFFSFVFIAITQPQKLHKPKLLKFLQPLQIFILCAAISGLTKSESMTVFKVI